MRALRSHVYLTVLLCASPALAEGDDGETAASADTDAAPASADKPKEAATQNGGISGVVEAPDLEAPLAGANVTVVGTDVTATTDDEGHYELVLKPGSYKVKAEVAGFKPVEIQVTVKLGVTTPADFQLFTAPLLNETVVVVGSRTPRTNVESTAAVDVITSDEIARSGRTQTSRILHTLAPSYVSTPQTIADGSDHVDPASLRGLGPDQVLVLVNGKRRHRSALMHVNGTFGRGTVGTDLNAIAVGSIKRIEILRDGAAAQYGSDAIAGVINIVTKDSTDVLGVSAESGITAARDGMQLRSSANYGFKIGQKGFVNITGEFLQKQATNRSGLYNGTVYSDDPNVDAQMLAMNGRSPEDFRMRIGEAQSIGGMGSYNLEIPITDSAATFYSFGDVSHRRGASAGFYRFPKQDTQNVSAFYPNGFLPEIRPTINDTAVTVGLRRKGTWDVDTSLTHGENSFKFNIENSVNASLGTASPTTFDAGTLHAEQTVADIDLVRKLDTNAVKALSFVLGSELRVERYQIEAGDEASYINGGAKTESGAPKIPGAQVFPGFQPSNAVDRSRDSIGVYAGAESEITKAWALDVGGRFESYSDFGRSLIGKVATRFKIANPVSVRATVNSGFRAPSLQQLWFSNVSTLFLPDSTGTLSPTQVLTSNNASPVTKAFGIPKLREERSTNASGGLTLRPTENLSLAVDGYFIRLRDRIVLTSQFSNANPIVAEILAPFPGVSQAQFFANAVDTDTAGVDIVLDYAVDVGDGGGTLAVSGGANLGYTKVIDVNIPQSLVDRFGGDTAAVQKFLFGRQAENRLANAVPHQKGTLALRYAYEGLSALVRANYYGAVYYRPDDPKNDETFGAKVLFDVDLGYQASKNMTLSVGADNLLDTYPDQQTKDGNRSFNRFLYSRNVSQFGQNGGFYYAKLDMTFF